MTIGSSAIGELAIGQNTAAAFVSLTASNLTTGSPAFGSPTVVCPLGIDPLVAVLLHCDGADFGTVFTDSAPSAHTFTAHNGAATTTFAPKFGPTTAIFDGVDDYIDTPDSADFTVGGGDFTVDFWYNTNGFGAGTTRRVCGQWDSANTAAGSAWNFTIGTSNLIGFNVSNGSAVRVAAATTAITAAGWHHVAGVRDGATLRLFLDGVQEGTFNFATDTVPDSAASLALGRRGDQNAAYFPGLIDEFRLSVGMARWIADFTPPVRAYGYCCMPSGLATGSPSLDTPTLSHHYSATANDLTTGSPVLGTPAASVNHALSAVDLTPGSPVLGTPTASVFYALEAVDIATAAPDLATPSLATDNQFNVDNLVTGAPVLDSPALAVLYALVAVDLETGSPVLGAPALILTLSAVDLAPASPDLGAPVLAITYPVNDLATGSPDLGTPALSHHYALFVFDFETGSPDLGTPIPFTSAFPLDLVTGSPDLGAPACSHDVMPRAEFLLNLGDTLLDPIYQSMISVPARVFPTTAGLPAVDLLCINHTSGIVVQFGIGVQTIRPAIDVRVRELDPYGVTREDMTGGQVMLWPDTDQEEIWNIETVFPRPGIWGEASGELRFYLMDREQS